MRLLSNTLFLVIPLTLAPTTHGQENGSADRAKIKAILDEGFAAWNDHDMVKFASHFTEDADFVNVQGTWWKGRKQIEKAHVAAHMKFFAKSRVKLIDHQIRFVRPDVAVVIVTSEMTGHDLPKGVYRTNFNRYTAVFVKENGMWMITSLENVNLAEPPEKQ